MQPELIFQPMLGMMLLTFCVWAYMYYLRLSWIAKYNPEPQSLSTPEKGARVLPESVNLPSYNLKNLFELPILFYALCLYLAYVNQVDSVQLALAYGFLIFRVVHSLVHCTLNRVLIRFAVYILSSLCLWAMIFLACLRVF